MTRKFFLSSVLAVLMVLSFVVPAAADGIIIPDPRPCSPEVCPGPMMQQLDIKYHHVEVVIRDQVAVTKVDQVFYNPNDWVVEGTYTFPLPQGAVVSNFKLWIDGEPVEGKVLDANAARAAYEEIVRQMRDPALLEYADRGAVMARIYPIQPQGERRIQLEYSQVLTAENGLVQYRYPLNTEKFSSKPLGNVAINVDIQSPTSITSAYSPSHSVAVSRQNANQILAGYEAANLKPDTDFLLYYSIGTEEGVHLITYRDPADMTDADGFFLMLISPPVAEQKNVIAKDVILVLDHSGSMEGEKFRQAQAAARFILGKLNPEDQFNLVAFSTGVEMFSSKLQPAAATVDGAAWLDQVSPGGSTDINSALLSALDQADQERPTYVVFLTDGLPTHGEVNSQRIIDNISQKARTNIRLFSFGVGYDVDTQLLDLLSQDHHGSSAYVLPGQSAEEMISSFYQRISSPAFTDLKLKVEGVSVYDVQPNPLPDLFYGSQMVVTGRYKSSGSADIHLTARTDAGVYDRVFSGYNFPESNLDQSSYLPRLWAARKIGWLLNQTRLMGPDQETIKQIVTLSIRYGIITPYTSFLVTEPEALGADAQSRIAVQEFNSQAAAPTQVSGQGAVEKAAQAGALSDADVSQPVSSVDQVKVAGTRTLIWKEGVWVDTRYDPQLMTTQKVKYLSKEYFALAKSDPDLAAGMAIGIRVVLVQGDKVYEVIE